MRLLRNRGVLSAMPAEEKLALGKWLLNCTHGDLAIKMHHFGRADMHKLAKEAFLCLAESCSREELEQVRAGQTRSMPIISLSPSLGNSNFLLMCRSSRCGAGQGPFSAAFVAGCTFKGSAMRCGSRQYSYTMSPFRTSRHTHTRGMHADARCLWSQYIACLIAQYLTARRACDNFNRCTTKLRRYGYVRYERRADFKPAEWWRISAWDRFPIVAGEDGVLVTTDPRHTRDKHWLHKTG